MQALSLSSQQMPPWDKASPLVDSHRENMNLAAAHRLGQRDADDLLPAGTLSG
jgi:hypothetical protein